MSVFQKVTSKVILRRWVTENFALKVWIESNTFSLVGIYSWVFHVHLFKVHGLKQTTTPMEYDIIRNRLSHFLFSRKKHAQK